MPLHLVVSIVLGVACVIVWGLMYGLPMKEHIYEWFDRRWGR